MNADDILRLAVECQLLTTENRDGIYADALIRFATRVHAEALAEQPAEQKPVGWLYEGIALHTREKTVFQKTRETRLETRWWRELGPVYTAPQPAIPLPEHETEAMHEAVMAVLYQGVTRTNTDALWQAYRSAMLNAAPETPQPAKPAEQCWKCGDMDPAGHAKCNVPACGMRDAPKPTKREPLTRDQVKAMLAEAGYKGAAAQHRADFINGLRHGERAHGIGEQP